MINEKRPNHKPSMRKAEKAFQDAFLSSKADAIQLYQVRKSYQRIFTPIVLLWCLIFQRLNPDHSCDAVVAELRTGTFDRLAQQPGKLPLSQRQRSESNAGYCQARKRLPFEFLEQAMQSMVKRMSCWTVPDPVTQDRPIVLLDGSTLLARPTPELERTFGRHKTAKRVSYWVVIRIVVLFCLRTGGCLGMKEGSLKTSEQELGKACLLHQPAGCIYIADRGFGVFSVVQAIRHSQGDAIVRLSRPRAQKLYPQQLYPGTDHEVVWCHSKKDQVDKRMSSDPITGRLIYVRLERKGFRTRDLYLFTTLADRQAFSRTKLIELYGLRWHVEVDLRYVKRTLDLYLLETKTVDMLRKELVAGLIAFNLLRLFATQAAQQAGFSPREMSLTQVLRRVTTFLFEELSRGTISPWIWLQFLDRLAQCRLTPKEIHLPEPRWVRPKDKSFPEFWDDRNAARARYLQRCLEQAVF
jgi:hypothetical protein